MCNYGVVWFMCGFFVCVELAVAFLGREITACDSMEYREYVCLKLIGFG